MMIEDLMPDSNRLFTSPLKDKDAMVLFSFYADGEAMKYRGSGPMKDVSDAQEMIDTAIDLTADKKKVRRAVRLKSNDLLVGTILLSVKHKSPNECEVGFSFGKEHWGQGFAQEILIALEAALIKQMKCTVLKAWCKKPNIASNRIFEKLEFELQKQDSFPDSNLYSKNIGQG